MRTWVVLLAAGLGVLGVYVAMLPIPEGIPQPWLLRSYALVVKVSMGIMNAGHTLGLFDKWDVMRRMCDAAVPPNTTYPGLKVQDEMFNGVRVRLYIPEGEKIRPGIITYHGGGWTIGSIESHEKLSVAIATEVDAVTMSVDYRLAPEHPYPVPLLDCEEATKYFMEVAANYGVDSKRIALLGDSAGGNLAAALALKFRGNSKYHVKLQVLLYPLLQVIDQLTPSRQFNKDILLSPYFGAELTLNYILGESWSEQDIQDYLANKHVIPEVKKKFYSSYLNPKHIPKKFIPDAFRENEVNFGNQQLWKRMEAVVLDPYFTPLLADDVTGVPEAYILTCGTDILRDDGIFYKKRLTDAKVRVTHDHLSYAMHGILSLDFLTAGQQALANVTEYLKKAL